MTIELNLYSDSELADLETPFRINYLEHPTHLLNHQFEFLSEKILAKKFGPKIFLHVLKNFLLQVKSGSERFLVCPVRIVFGVQKDPPGKIHRDAGQDFDMKSLKEPNPPQGFSIKNDSRIKSNIIKRDIRSYCSSHIYLF